ncbi:MAG: hypothetical protein ACRCZC_06905, partial [Culicoidibacterales bacterium]
PNFEAADAPTVYKHQGQEAYFDRWQKRFVPVNDFQALKQYIGLYLLEAFAIPEKMLQSAMPFREYRLPSDRVGDFVIEYYRQGVLKPLVYVKCSKQFQDILPSMITKAHESAMELGSRYVLLTNGIAVYFAQLNQLGTEYEVCELVPYEQMIPEKAGEQVATKPFVRQTQEELASATELREKEYKENWYTIGTSLKNELVPVAVNLAEAYFDETCVFAANTHQAITLVEDLGLRELDEQHIHGVAPEGFYRTFLIHDQDNNYNIVSIIIAAGPDGPKQTTSLYCLFDDEKTSYQVLQLDLNRSANFDRETLAYQLWHNGRIAKRRDEATVTAEIIEYIRTNCPDILVDGKISFTAVETKAIVTAEQADFVTLTMQLLNYSNIRNKYLSA